MKPTRIPVFPLDVVLLPGMLLPLHIFEPRYKTMIKRCLDEQIEFGIILVSEKGIAKVGCTAEIAEKLKQYPDGRMDILTVGSAVFRIIELLNEKEYHEAIIEYLPEDVLPQDPDNEARLLADFQKCHALIFGQPWDDANRDTEISLAYQMAAQLPLDLEEKQKLLEMGEESERRAFLMRQIKEVFPQLVRRQHMQKIAGSNGHAVN
jgi:ATP-dependent Lon protease